MSVSYSTIKSLSEPDAITRFLQEQVVGPALPSMRITDVRSRGRRLEAPRTIWNVYEGTVRTPEGTAMSVLFWTRAFFDDGECQDYLRSIGRLLNSRNGNPLDPTGHARFFPDLNLFLFFFPSDPVFPALGTVFDPDEMQPLLAEHLTRLAPGASIRSLTCVRVRYLPEIACIVRYEADIGQGRPVVVYGKVQPGRRGQMTFEVMQALWELPARASGELVLAMPLAYYPRYTLLLQTELPGEEVEGDRGSEVFQAQCVAAGKAIAHIHSSGVSVGRPHSVGQEIDRLAERLDEFKLSAPRLYLQLRDLLKQIGWKAQRVPAEASVPSHGDYKYNQFLFDGRQFGLVDVEYFCQAEPSFDLGKYCGHLAPALPDHWSDTLHANTARRTFLDAYLSIRPDYKGARFGLYESLSLATRALVVMWSQSGNWQYTAETLVALAFERLKTPWGE